MVEWILNLQLKCSNCFWQNFRHFLQSKRLSHQFKQMCCVRWLRFSNAAQAAPSDYHPYVVEEKSLYINPTIFNIIRWVDGSMGWMHEGHSKLFFFIFVKLWKNKKINWNDFSKEFCNKSWKKISLGTSDTWSLVHLYKRTSVRA